jgi:Domain of unknown function (DUF6089)
MKRLLLTYLCLQALHGSAQNMHEVGRSTFACFQGGPSKYLGDVGGHPTSIGEKLSLDASTFFYGISVQRFYKRRFSWEIGINAGSLRASDADIQFTSTADPEYLRYRRNLNFRTNIIEGSIAFHFYPLQFLSSSTRVYHFPVQPFFYGGFGYYQFNPQGSVYDIIYKTTVWQDLKPLHTEGQGYAEYPDRKEYSLQQVNIPYGWGLTYFVADNFFISASMNGRKLFTDYLDDVSTNYIDTKLHNKYIFTEEEIEQAIIFSDKSPFIDPSFKNNEGDIRGNTNKQDSFFNYNIKIGFRLARKKSKKSNFYKFDDNEICN